MKLYIIITAMMLVLTPGLLVNGKPAGDSGLLDIIDMKGKKLPADGVANRRQHDVRVYYTAIDDSGAYTVFFYRTENKILRRYKAIIGSDKELTKAGYRWLNDSLVMMHLYNPELKSQLDFKVTGYGTARGEKTTTVIMGENK